MRVSSARFGYLILLALFMAFSVQAENVTRYETTAASVYNDAPSAGEGFAGPFTFPFELDEQIGDTFSVGYTWRDMQHNGTIGQMIGVGFDPDNNNEMMIHCVWTGREGPEEGSTVLYNKVTFNENNEPFINHSNPYGARIDNGGDTGFGAYTVLYTYMDDNLPMVAYHGQTSNTSDYISYVTVETSFMDFFFNPKHPIPNYPTSTGEWPHMAIAEYNGVKYQHTVLQPDDEDDFEQSLFYNRHSYNGATFADVTPGGGVQQVTDVAMNLSANVAASRNGDRVAIGQTVSRWLQRGSIPSGWDGLAIGQSDNDIYIWESTDGGETWDWDNPMNITNFIEPNPDYLPDDTLNANQDTIRAYTEVEMSYDEDDVLHVIFQTNQFDHFRETTYRSGRIYYWNSLDQTFSMVGDGSFWNYALNRTWERLATHGSVQKDSEGVLWALWQQSGEEGDTVIINDTIYTPDVSDDGYANTDLYVSASMDNGKRWMQPVNVTNTRSTEWDLMPGDSRSEVEPSLAPYVDGDYLHIMYTLDFDPGISVPGGVNDQEGEPTRNQQVYQRIPKSQLYTMFAENAAYQEFYPLHIDSSDCYIDENGWEWDNPLGVPEDQDTKLTPDQFQLKQNYPNPFNPSTQIAFDLKASGRIKLAVYDILGREVATLLNRHMEIGQHSVSFVADELPSGVYFYKLASGDASQVRKMVLMK